MSLRPHPPVLAALAALLLAGPAAAIDLVVFEDGRTLEVRAIDLGPETSVLELDGGGRMIVPSHRIVEHYELPTDPPVVAEPTPVAVAEEPADSTIWREAAGDLAEVIASAADRNRLDPALLTAVAHVESRFDPGATSPKGAQGVLQLMPATAERFGVSDAYDPEQNVEGGARYLSWLIERFEGRTDLALAGYNAGENAVDRYSGIPPYPETRAYVSRVLEQVDLLSGGAALATR